MGFINIHQENQKEDRLSTRYNNFRNYSSKFLNMINSKYIYTKFDIVTMVMSTDGVRVYTILKARDYLYLVKSFDIVTDKCQVEH